MNIDLTCNNALALSCPDGFHKLDSAERASLKMLAEGPGEVLSDPDRHILLSIGWKPVGTLTALLLNTKDVAKNMNMRLRKALKPYSCQERETLNRMISGKRAEGLAYEYDSNGIRMLGQSYVAKHGKAFYFLHFYVRSELKAESLPVCEEILASVKWL